MTMDTLVILQNLLHYVKMVDGVSCCLCPQATSTITVRGVTQRLQ